MDKKRTNLRMIKKVRKSQEDVKVQELYLNYKRNLFCNKRPNRINCHKKVLRQVMEDK